MSSIHNYSTPPRHVVIGNEYYCVHSGYIWRESEKTCRKCGDTLSFSEPEIKIGDGLWVTKQTVPGKSLSVFDENGNLVANVVSEDLAELIVKEHNSTFQVN